MEKRKEIEIDVIDLLFYLRKKILLILAVTILCGVVGYAVTKVLIEPKYTASTRVYVLNRSNENMVVYSDYQISTQMLSDYKVLITGRNVTKEVVERLGLEISSAELSQRITVSAPEGTRFVQISVVDTNPERAAKIANMVREIASVQIQKLMDVDAVNLVYEAEVPNAPSAPNVTMYTFTFAVIGLMVMLLILMVVYLSDDAIHTEEDVNRYLKLSVLGVIPMSEELEDQKKAIVPHKKTGRKAKNRTGK